MLLQELFVQNEGDGWLELLNSYRVLATPYLYIPPAGFHRWNLLTFGEVEVCGIICALSIILLNLMGREGGPSKHPAKQHPHLLEC